MSGLGRHDGRGESPSLWTRIRSTTVIRDFFILLTGAGFGQLILLAVMPLLTRLLTPADMGLFGTFTTFVAILSIMSSLGFETAIISAREDDELPLVGIACMFALFFTLVAAALFYAIDLSRFVAGLPQWFPWLVALDTLMANCFIAAQYWYIRQERYKRASLGAFALNSGRAAGSLGCAVTLPGPLALPVGDCIGRAIGLLVLDRLYVVPRAVRYLCSAPAATWIVVRRYWKSAIFLMPAATLEVVFFWLPVLLSTIVFGIELAGHVALVQRILSAPLALVGRSLADIYQVRITGHGAAMPDHMIRATFVVIGGVIALAAPVCLIFFLWGEPIFRIVFGPHWTIAGNIVGLLAPLATMQLCGNIITRLLIVTGRQELKLFAYLALIASTLTTFYLGSQLAWGPLRTLAIMSASNCLIMTAWILTSLLVCRSMAEANPAEADAQLKTVNGGRAE